MSFFHKKLFGYAPAQEGLEELTAGPKDDVTVPDVPSDKPAESKSDEQEVQETGEAADAPETPADAALDSGAGSGDVFGNPEGGTSVDPTADPEDADAVDADEPIVYPELDKLNVNQVLDVEAVSRKLSDDQDMRHESVDEAIAQSKDFVAAMEELIVLIRKQVGISPLTANGLAVSLERRRENLGFPKGTPAMEAFDQTVEPFVPNAKIALEGFRSTLRTILDQIVKTIQAAVAWLVKYIKDSMYSIKEQRQLTQVVTQAVMEQRRSDKDGVVHSAILSEDKFVTLQGIGGSQALCMLKILNMQPGNYSSAYKDITNVVKTHRAYPDVFDAGFLERVQGVFDAVSKDVEVDAKVPITDKFDRLLPAGAMVMRQRNLQGVKPPARLGGRWEGAYVHGLLGDIAFYYFYDLDSARGKSIPDSVDLFSAWDVQRVHMPSTTGSNDGWLRYLSTPEIEQASKAVAELEDCLLELQDTSDHMASIQTKLKELAQRASSQLAPMQYTEAFFDPENKEHGWKGEFLTDTVNMVHNLVGVINKSLFQYQTYGFSVCVAWNYYLKAIYDKEKVLLAADRKVMPANKPA